MAISFDENLRANLCGTAPRFRPATGGTGPCAIAGGAPSILDYLEAIKALQPPIFASVSSQNWLVDKGITPTFCIVTEVELDPVQIQARRHEGVMYLVGSHCHPANFDFFAPNVRLWHSTNTKDVEDRIKAVEPDALLIGGRLQWATRALEIGRLMGHRHFECYGLDSSFTGQSHAYMDVPDSPFGYMFREHKYQTNHGLWRQAKDFMKFCKDHPDLRIALHGHGLLPDMLRSR